MNLTSDLFYCLLKLTSGEELLAKVCSFIENDEVFIVLDNPIIVSMSIEPYRRIPLVKVQPWISLSDETIYIIRRKDIITMTEVKDRTLVNIHQNYESKMKFDENSQVQTESVLSVEKARKELEKIYLLNNKSKTQD